MSYDYSENILVQESAGHLLERELATRLARAMVCMRVWALRLILICSGGNLLKSKIKISC